MKYVVCICTMISWWFECVALHCNIRWHKWRSGKKYACIEASNKNVFSHIIGYCMMDYSVALRSTKLQECVSTLSKCSKGTCKSYFGYKYYRRKILQVQCNIPVVYFSDYLLIAFQLSHCVNRKFPLWILG